QRQEGPPACVACGGASTGYNYEAPSCLPCKTFFRRKVLEEKVYPACFKDGMCSKNESIRPCKSCRLDRCINGGMNPLLISGVKNPDVNPIVQRVLRRRANYESERSVATTSADAQAVAVVLTINPIVIECLMDKIIGSLVHLEHATHELRVSSQIDPQVKNGYRLNTVLAGPPVLSSTVLNVFTPPQAPIPESQMSEIQMLMHKLQLWGIIDLYISIEYMKTFNFFNGLSHDDKRTLVLHAAVMCAHLTHTYFSYENKSDRTIFPDGISLLRGCFYPDEELDRLIFNGVIKILRDLDIDKKEYVLLKAIIVCNPAIDGLSTSHKVEIENERLKFARSLMSYVLCRRGTDKGPAAFTEMIAVIDILTRLAKRHKNWHVLCLAMQSTLVVVREPSLINDVFAPHLHK
ncbi:hypothetical protein PENTCL1PPCAC_15098, partial [Pristionchus entomophagus]